LTYLFVLLIMYVYVLMLALTLSSSTSRQRLMGRRWVASVSRTIRTVSWPETATDKWQSSSSVDLQRRLTARLLHHTVNQLSISYMK